MGSFYKPTAGSPLLFVVTNQYGKRVILEKSRFDDHIIGPPEDGHKEFIGQEHVIKESIEKPNLIYLSSKFPSSWLYVCKSTASRYPLLNIKTVVSHRYPNYGYVVTSFYQRDKDIEAEREGAKIIYDEKVNKHQL